MVLGRLRSAGTDREASEALVASVSASEQGKTALTRALEMVGVDDPTEKAAQDLLDLIDAEKKAKFNVDASQAKGVYIGDGGTQNNTFN